MRFIESGPIISILDVGFDFLRTFFPSWFPSTQAYYAGRLEDMQAIHDELRKDVAEMRRALRGPRVGQGGGGRLISGLGRWREEEEKTFHELMELQLDESRRTREAMERLVENSEILVEGMRSLSREVEDLKEEVKGLRGDGGGMGNVAVECSGRECCLVKELELGEVLGYGGGYGRFDEGCSESGVDIAAAG